MLDKCKKAQAGEAMSWIVATLIIIFLLSVSVYGATLLAKKKVVSYSDKFRTEDIVMKISLFSYFTSLDYSSKENLYENLKNLSENEKFYGDFDSEFKKLDLLLVESNGERNE